MLMIEKWRQWFLYSNIALLLLIAIGSCGISGSDNKTNATKEKSMSAGDTNLAYNKGASAAKKMKTANTEKATFALG